MNFEIFKQSDSSGRFSKEKWMTKNYPEESKFIIDWYANLKSVEISFAEKLFLFLNNISVVPRCQNKNCSNRVEFLSLNRGYRKYCSNICISSDSELKKLKKENSLKKWGVTHPQKHDIVKKKAQKTNLDKYGFVSPMMNEHVIQKSKQTLLSNFGVENPAKSEFISAKRIESFKKSNWKESFQRTSLEKYDTVHPWQNEEIHNKSVQSSKLKRNTKTSMLLQKKLLQYSDYSIQSIDFDSKSIHMICPKGHTYTIARHTFDERCAYKTELCLVCKPLCSGISGLELQVSDFLSQICSDIKTKTKEIIPPLELDIFIPSKNLAIEFNGLFWHSSANKSKDYHKIKWQKCHDLGIRIINIWEDDWIYRQDVVKSHLLYSLGVTQKKIGARECIIREVNSKQSSEFLESNHLQGACKSSCRLGLFHDDELVSLMTFSKPRLPLSSTFSEGAWELTRFCNKIDYVVNGAASKILRHFETHFKPKLIETYSDNSHFDGKLYETLGFVFKHITKPGYWYLVDGKRDYRFNWRKSKLIQLGADSNKTEEEIMSEWGYPRIYNAGNKKWIKSY